MQYLSMGKVIHPIIEQITHIDVSDTSFVLIVEKDALFMRLLVEGFVQQHHCVLITSKGYPDVATRLFLHKLSREYPHLPILCLTDFDPHGIEIAMTYFYGALTRMAHQRHELYCKSMRWIGLHLNEDFHRCGIHVESLENMSDRDKRKAQRLIQILDPNSRIQQDMGTHNVQLGFNEMHWKSSLDLMLLSGKKAEVECLNSVHLDFMTAQYLPWKITEAMNEMPRM